MMLRKLLPSPLLSLALWAAWLVLNSSVSPGHLVLGALLALAVPWFTEPLRPDRIHPHAPLVLLKLLLVVLWDVIVSNIDVARRILGPERAIKQAYVWVPLTITSPHGRIALAGIITMTPGTLSAQFSDDGRWLLVHAFNVDDEPALIASIKQRYERPLLEILQ
jgi:multicomponent K+:H+ antiporter subunit E